MTSQVLNIKILDDSPPKQDFYAEVIHGLRQQQKVLSPKFLYDELGSALFEQITRTKEYYPTRAEKEILNKHASEIGEIIGEDAALIELGSGNSEKIAVLLNNIQALAHYIPIDISKEILSNSIKKLSEHFEELSICGICTDFTKPITLPHFEHTGKKVIFYPGSTLGNFEKQEAFQFLKDIKGMLNKGDGILIGIDLKKDSSVMHEAYNDSLGVTEKFNLNLLTRMNRELGANFNPTSFSHHAFYDEEIGRIEMHIKSLQNQTVYIGKETFTFKKGETIHTENSYKYSIEEFHTLAKASGISSKNVWTDENNLFSVHYLEIH